MKKMTLIIILSIFILLIIFINLYIRIHPVFGATKKFINQEKLEASPNFKDGKFQNIEVTSMMTGNENRRKIMKKFIVGVENSRPDELIKSVAFDKES